MAGEGRRFKNFEFSGGVSYDCPKPLLPIKNKHMYQWALKALDNLEIEYDEIIYIIRLEDEQNYNISQNLTHEESNVKVVALSHTTDGAALTVKAATPYLDLGDSVIISNCDQYMEQEWFYSDILQEILSGVLPTMMVK